LNSQAYAEDEFIQLPGGSDVLSGTYVPHPIAPNNSYNSSQGSVTVSVAQATTTVNLTSSQTTINSGSTVTLTATVLTASIGLAPSGTVTFLNGGAAMSGTVSYTSANASSAGYATLTATFTTPALTSTATFTAQYSGDSNYTGSTSPAVTVSISSGTPDFSISATPNSFAISSPGASGQTSISTTALNSFTGTVSFTCTVPTTMSESNCTMAPTSASVGGTSLLTVNTTAPSAAFRPVNPPRWLIPSAGALLASLLLLLFPARKRRAQLAFGLLVFALLAAAFVACGGGSSSTGPPPNSGTPTGTYSITVTGTSGNLSHSVNVAVTVQ